MVPQHHVEAQIPCIALHWEHLVKQVQHVRRCVLPDNLGPKSVVGGCALALVSGSAPAPSLTTKIYFIAIRGDLLIL